MADPVCGMRVDPQTAASAERDGGMYWFCSAARRDAFTGKRAHH
ncbi:YHS domain-containing protein [Nonomuraea lactucae]|nr:YHS domain-containing protein [Nonomuraea lactucae]